MADRLTAQDRRNYTKALKEIGPALLEAQRLREQETKFRFTVCGSPSGQAHKQKAKEEAEFYKRLRKAREKVNQLHRYIAKVENLKNLYELAEKPAR